MERGGVNAGIAFTILNRVAVRPYCACCLSHPIRIGNELQRIWMNAPGMDTRHGRRSRPFRVVGLAPWRAGSWHGQ